MHCLFFQTDANLTSALVQKQEAEKHPCNPLLNSLHTPRCEQMPKQEAEKHPCKFSNRQTSQCQEAEKHPRVITAQLPQLSISGCHGANNASKHDNNSSRQAVLLSTLSATTSANCPCPRIYVYDVNALLAKTTRQAYASFAGVHAKQSTITLTSCCVELFPW